MIESQYTTNVSKRLPKNVMSWKINDSYAGGVPDAFYRRTDNFSRPLWVEYKFIKTLPKRMTTMIVPNLSAQQLMWLKQARNAGEQAIVIIGCEALRHTNNPCGVILSDPKEWEEGIATADFELRAAGQTYQSVANKIYILLSE